MSEIKHYSEETIVKALHGHMSRSSTCRIAVAYCGAAAYKFFPERRALWPEDLRIIVDASAETVRRGLTNPKGLSYLLGFTAQLKSLRGLHAKVFIFDDTVAIVGSVNLSESSIKQQYQLSLEVSDPETVYALIHWFDKSIWARGHSLDFPAIKKLEGLWPGKEFRGSTEKTNGSLPEWHSGPPEPRLNPSDVSIRLNDVQLANLLSEFKSNTCRYSSVGETCEQMSTAIESDLGAKSIKFHELMNRSNLWTSEDLGTIFDLAYTNGKAAKMQKPRFVRHLPGTVARSLKFLIDSKGDPFLRMEKLADTKNEFNLVGLSNVGLIFLLHLWSPKEFPVVNKSVETAFEVLKLEFSKNYRTGEGFRDRTVAIGEIAKRTGIKSLARTDHFLDAIGKGHIGPLRIR